MPKKVVIIGAGIGGLGTAALLAKDGYEVIVLEKNEMIGGRARIYKEAGFSFDMGPSWYMMPDAFIKYFGLFNKKPADYFNLKQLDIHYRVFFSPDIIYDIKKELKENYKLFAETEKNGDKKLVKYLENSKFLYNTSMKDLVYQDYESIWPLFNPKIIKNIFKLKLLQSFHKYTSSLFKNKNLQKILEFTTVFLGGSPYETPAFYTLITHTDFNLGVYHPMGGIHQVVIGLKKLCEENGVKIIINEEAIEIDIKNGKAIGVKTKNNYYKCDIVVGNADYPYCETKLIEKKWQTYNEKYWEKSALSPTAFLIYLGIKGKVEKLKHHNLYFDKSWEEHYESVFKNKNWPNNPSYYVHCPSKTDASMAPQDGETLIFLAPVAPGMDDNEEIRENFSKKLISHLEFLIGENLSDRILVKRIYSHRDFKKDYNAYKGASLGLAHTLFQTAIFRPKNRSKKVKNLFYVGHYTNPGVGMPVVLISAQIVHKSILKNYAN